MIDWPIAEVGFVAEVRLVAGLRFVLEAVGIFDIRQGNSKLDREKTLPFLRLFSF